MRHLTGLLAALAGLAAGITPVWADPADWTFSPYQTFLGAAELDLGGQASGALFGASGHGGQAASGIVKLMPHLHRDYDSGWSLGVNATISAGDPLSRLRGGGNSIEKLYGEVQTGLGQLQIGQTSGVTRDLIVTGPKVDELVSVDDPQTTFFADPRTGHPVIAIFPLRVRAGDSSNYAKIAYLSPRLFGVQVALSFTPSQGKEVLPFLHEGPDVAGRQAGIWEGAIRYSGDLGPATYSAYGGVAVGHAENKPPGQEGLTDLGTGARIDWPVNDDVTLSAGGAYRQSNAYTFHLARSFQTGTTHALQASTSATYDAWMLGAEYGGGDADSVGGAPRIGVTGYQVSLGYTLNANIQAVVGWQRLTYNRSSGTFYNDSPHLGLDAVFLHLNLHT